MRHILILLLAAVLGVGSAEAGGTSPEAGGTSPEGTSAEAGGTSPEAGGTSPEGTSPEAGGTSATPADVLLITVDTLRPDALGWVAGRGVTPHVDRLAAEGFRFPAAASPAPVTQPSHGSLFSGMIPRRHGVRDNGQVMGGSPALLAERLRDAGYATGAFVSGFPLAAASGLDRGFDHYDDAFTRGDAGRLERPAAETTTAALAWAATLPAPRFLWIHYWDPHDPYDPPPGFARDGPRGAYDGEVTYVDQELGRLLAGLPARDRLTLFTADHGESLGEHGEETHGFFVYQSTTTVPLIFHWPKRVAPGTSTAGARLVDVAPTLLELLGLPPLPPGVDGVSLTPLLAGRELELPPAYVETRRPWLSYGWAPLRAVRAGDWKLIAAPRPELYDLASDPGETVNLAGRERSRARQLRDALLRVENRPAADAASTADPETLDRLSALGYTGAGSTAGEPPPDAPDPKDRLEQWARLSEAVELLEAGQYRQAVTVFDRVLAEEPGNPFALSRSGVALKAAGDLPAAAARLARAAEVRPDDPETHDALAVVLARTGRDAEATRHWMELVRLQPERVDAWVNLATSLGRTGRDPEAIRALERAAELAPERPELRIRLGFVENARGNVARAVEHLELAARAVGEHPFPHAAALGLLLLRLDRAHDAAPWLERSRPEEAEFGEARLALAQLAVQGGDVETARRELALALAARPELRARAEADPVLAGLLR